MELGLVAGDGSEFAEVHRAWRVKLAGEPRGRHEVWHYRYTSIFGRPTRISAGRRPRLLLRAFQGGGVFLI